MAIELRQQLKLTQQLIMTPQLQMAIKLLQLSRLELMDAIQQEMEENPALEEMQETLPKEQVETEPQEPVSTLEKTKEVTIHLAPCAFEFYDSSIYKMNISPGQYELFYGNSSNDRDLKAVKVEIQ